MNVMLRAASQADASAIHFLVTANVETGHLLPRTIDEIVERISRFVVAELDGDVVGCAELARLSPTVAEVRSLVVAESLRGQRIGTRLVSELASKATSAGYASLCAFTHDPSHFVKLGFTIVPHIWMPEKIAHDCTACPLFRRCGQYAVTLPLRAGVHVGPEAPPAVIYGGRNVAPRRPHIERLHLQSVDPVAPVPQAIPACERSSRRTSTAA